MVGNLVYVTDILDISAHYGDWERGVWDGVQVTVESLGLKKFFEDIGSPGYYAVSFRYANGSWGCIHGAKISDEIRSIDWEL